MEPVEQPNYLQPYARAVRQHGAEFPALLWATPQTQAARFEAMAQLQDPTGLTVLDLGCGRADFLDWMIANGMRPRKYVGIEGVAELAGAAEEKGIGGAKIIRADFIREPFRTQVHADVIYCSGAFNTIEDGDFYPAVKQIFANAGRAMIFNFLCSPLLAGADYLHWRDRQNVVRFRADAERLDVMQHEGISRRGLHDWDVEEEAGLSTEC